MNERRKRRTPSSKEPLKNNFGSSSHGRQTVEICAAHQAAKARQKLQSAIADSGIFVLRNEARRWLKQQGSDSSNWRKHLPRRG